MLLSMYLEVDYRPEEEERVLAYYDVYHGIRPPKS